jgi:hypothetical protein
VPRKHNSSLNSSVGKDSCIEEGNVPKFVEENIIGNSPIEEESSIKYRRQ